MKKLALFMSTMLVTLCVSAQKLQKPRVDKITGDTAWITSSEKLYGKPSFSGTVGEQLFVSAGRLKGIYLLMFSIQTGKSSIFLMNEGQKVYIKLKNDSVVTLTNNKGNVSKFNTVGYGSNTNCSFILSTKEIESLANSDVTFIRIEHSDGTFEYDIKDKFSDVIKSLVQLIKAN